MESCGFQSQLLSVMEVLAQAAVAEINRRVEDSCAVLRLEVSQSRRDIDLLKSKCEVLEAELRRSRMRARRKVCYTPADETFSSSVKDVFNSDSLSTDWDTQIEAETSNQSPKSADMQPADEAEHLQIKEEMEEEEMWRNAPKDKQISGAEQLPYFGASQPAPTDGFLERLSSAENPVNPEPLLPPADRYNTFQEQQLNGNQSEPELRVKHEMEEESDKRAAPLDSGHTFVEAEAELWSTNLCRDAGDPSVSYAGRQTEQIPSEFASRTSLHLEDTVPRTHSVGKSHSVLLSAARVKKRARTFACKRLQPDEGHSAFPLIGPVGSSLVPQQSDHQYGAGAAHTRNPDGGGGGGFVLARRMRAPWRSGHGEKRFSCTYCDKSFTRFSQLKEHLRSHTGEKPFSCMQCGRSFTKQCNLIRHAVVHSGEKPYQCSQCGKCFTQRSSLKSHQKTVH
ncbi:uncharacterized protein PAE49_015938 [Odontesthes bonariensis]|uniref:uncharacterized protein LOC142398239 n=1 Tax=Odontesthes bonariensis TaxID=219752 RepID=UPI003F58EC18